MSDLNNQLKFHVEWEDPGAAAGAELRATWCRFSMQIGPASVTRVDDKRAQTVRDAVYGPAYPLAEWFAFNWWSLLHEIERPSSAVERHNLRFAREGFALPDLELFSEESFVRAVWRIHKPVGTPVRFIDEGFALLERKAVTAEIASFVNTVLARLESQGISGTALAEEWAAVGATPKAQKEFCETAGALGLDPYDLDDSKADEILTVAEKLPADMKREFFLAADSNSLTKQARWVSKCLKQLGDYEIKTKLAGKKGLYRSHGQSSPAWQTGYELAEKFRREFNLGSNQKAVSVEKLCGAKKGNLPLFRVGEEHQLDAVTKLGNELGPQVATSKTRESSKAYLLARSVCDYLCSASEESTLLTRVSSDRQKRNRAFAAELLAPADGLRKHLSGSRISRHEITDVAAHFGVSEWLVEHQVRNHRLAEIEGTRPLLALG